MNCIICNQEIENDSQFINGNWYHNKCIENLQQENERLKEENKRIFSKVNDDELLISNAMNYAELTDYKSRCKKAIGRISLLKMDDITIETNKALDYVLKSLNGSDDK